MSGIAENIKNNLITVLATAICSFLGFLLIGIFSDILPAVLPPLQRLPITLYLKIILLLLTLLSLSITTIIILAFKSRPFQPVSEKGRFLKINYGTRFDYRRFKEDKELVLWISWLCPIHKTVMNPAQDTVNKQLVPSLFCTSCGKHYYLKDKETYIKPDDASGIIRERFFQKINIRS